MTTPSPDVHGPIDFVLLEFPEGQLRGEAAAALTDLVERDIVRIYDLLVIAKHADGSVELLELTTTGTDSGGFAYFAGARSGLLGDEDVQEAAGAMRTGTVAALIVYENTWAIPFVAATRNAGGELIASARIPASEVMATLEALEESTV